MYFLNNTENKNSPNVFNNNMVLIYLSWNIYKMHVNHQSEMRPDLACSVGQNKIYMQNGLFVYLLFHVPLKNFSLI
jgi:hypothetical protein